MAKMVVLQSCAGCESLESECDEDGDVVAYWCVDPAVSADDIELRPPLAIPPWCPLRDAPDWVAVSSGELPQVAEDNDGDGMYVLVSEDGWSWERAIFWFCDNLPTWTLEDGTAITPRYWLRGMPPLPKEEASDE